MTWVTRHIDIVFDGPPSHESGRFVEVEDADGKNISIGEWIETEGGRYWVLRFPDPRVLADTRDREERLLQAGWHHSVKDGKYMWRTFLNLGVPGHWSDGSTLIEIDHADRAEAARLAEISRTTKGVSS